jgi:hypothetical protein
MTMKDRLMQFINYKDISVQAFETNVNLSNGAVSKMGDGTRRSTIDKISNFYPDLNTNWLLTGEGDMLKPIQSVGDISNSSVSGVNVNGREIHINPDAYNTLLKIVESNQRTTEKFQEQIDRLISIIENKYGTTNR